MTAGEESRIGAYRIERLLGRGGMGEVWLAWDERLERRVALKRIRGDSLSDGRLRERFRREARAAARLSHPAVVQVHDLLEDGAGECIVLEYVEGRTLASLLAAAGPPETRLALRLAREIAEGLAHAHAQGLLHRDLKTENVIVTPDGHAKILDFGLSKPVSPEEEDANLTAHGAVLGTLRSMSPEQALGRGLDERADLFSLGVLLYELLTGRSPFRGASTAETLDRLLHHEPSPLALLRPDLPPELPDLVTRLLSKDRSLRPGSAREVVRTLGRLAAPSAPSFPPEGLSELATGPRVPERPQPQPWPQPTATRGRPLRSRALAAIVATTAAAAAFLLLSGLRAAPLRIVVPSPAVADPANERLGLVASGVLSAALATLSSLEGAAPLEPSQLGGSGTSPMELARSSAADEVLLASVAAEGEMARVSLKRVQGSDGRVLWARTFQVPAAPRDLALMADAVQVHLRQAWPDHPPRPGTPDLEARDEDYRAFLEVKRRVDSGKTSWAPELERIEGIVRGSPRFLEAWLLGSRVALSLFEGTREPAHLERARGMVREARDLAPNDPRPLVEDFRITLATDHPEEGRKVLEQLDRLLPGDPELLVLRARLARHTGRTEEAFNHLRTAVERAPSWRNLYWLADLEARNGLTAEARGHLDLLLARSPGNFFALEKLAGMELLVGDLGRAERLYLKLLDLAPQRSHYTNLGLARFLLGRHKEAVAAYREALELDPDHVAVLLNLADAESALGRRQEAERLYRRVLDRLLEQESAAVLSPGDRMIKAQCLARLGRSREAVEVTQRTLQQNPDDPEVLYLAALVYSLAGDRASALVNARLARDKGTRPRWFSIAAFQSLRDDPEFQSLVASP